jgi:MoaA/NifB/PqqE/SkfB family radical SAM enzyme
MNLGFNPMTNKIIMWALTYKCNLRCQYCFLSHSKSKYSTSLPESSKSTNLNIAKVISKSSDWKPEAVWLTGGEPTLRNELLDIIALFKTSNIYSVLTTNGKFTESYARDIVDHIPRAISVSLDSHNMTTNDKLRGDSRSIINNINIFANTKHKDTILGVSIVIDENNVSNLFDFAKYLSDIGVDYLSINLRYDPDNAININNSTIANILKNQIAMIEDNRLIKLPSKLYLDLVMSYCHGDLLDLKCPATKDYFFISPWGWAYPCSSEFWHSDSQFTQGFPVEGEGLKKLVDSLFHSINSQELGTFSPCFSCRCLGCWKIFYNNIIFGVLKYV